MKTVAGPLSREAGESWRGGLPLCTDLKGCLRYSAAMSTRPFDAPSLALPRFAGEGMANISANPDEGRGRPSLPQSGGELERGPTARLYPEGRPYSAAMSARPSSERLTPVAASKACSRD